MKRNMVTIYVPDGYADADEFLKDCQFEAAGPLAQFDAIIESLNYDGPDTNSLSVGEIRQALP